MPPKKKEIKKKIHIKKDPIPCIVHKNCTVYGFHNPEFCRAVNHLAVDTMIHARELLRIDYGRI